MSGRCATHPRSAAEAAKRSGASRATSMMCSNLTLASDGERLTTGRASAGGDQGSGASSATPASPTQKREDKTETEVEQRLAALEHVVQRLGKAGMRQFRPRGGHQNNLFR